MAAGDWHKIDKYEFLETLLGPMVERVCVDCGLICYATPAYKQPRCEKCLKKIHGITTG